MTGLILQRRRARGKLGLLGKGAVDVDTDSDDRDLAAGLDEDAADLFPADQHIVGHLIAGANPVTPVIVS